MGPEIFVTFGRYITDRTLVLHVGASIKSTELHAANAPRPPSPPSPIRWPCRSNLATDAGAAWAPRIVIHDSDRVALPDLGAIRLSLPDVH